MLLHSGGHVQPSCYYPDPSYLPQHATPPPPHFDIDAFLSSHPTAFQDHHPYLPQHDHTAASYLTLQQQTYYHYHHHHHFHHRPDDLGDGVPQHQNPASSPTCSCSCPWKPVQETFLHKILTGKGYQNDAIGEGPPRSMLVPEASFVDGGHFNAVHGFGTEFALASTSCCYSGRSDMSMSMHTSAFPPSIPGF